MPASSQTLRRKLLAWLLLPLLILFFLRTGYNYYYGNALANRVYDRMLVTLADSLIQQIAYDSTKQKLALSPAAPKILLSDEHDRHRKKPCPLKRLHKAVSERSHLDLSPLSGDAIPAEVQPLIHAINDLMARLSEVLDVQNRFIADAAHQLRTPLAGLKTQIELALRQDDPTNALASLKSLHASTGRMTRLVSQLLALARNEPNAQQAIRKDLLDLGILASNITMDWVPRALDKQIDLGYEAPAAAVTLYGDAASIKDLLDNLIDNAVRYTPPNGRITVSVFTGHGRVHLIVNDNGPGIPPEHRERVFERFYSVLGHNSDGSGLGLAIVREIARMHSGEVSIESGLQNSGTRVNVVF